jgi:predicted MFS family arabinose efflux permease
MPTSSPKSVAAQSPAWSLVAAGTALIAASYGLARYAYGLYLPTLRAEFDLSATAAGDIGSAAYGSYGLAVMAGVLLTARGYARAAAILAGATATLGTGLIAAAGSPAALASGVAIAGASTGLAFPPLVALVAATVRADARDRAQMIVNAGTGFGVVVSGPSAVLAAGHWRWSWALFAALSFVVTVAIATTTRRAGPVAESAAPRRGRQSTAEASPRQLPLILGAVGLGVASSAYWTFGRDLLAEAGAASHAAPALWTVLGAAGILGALTADLVARYRIAATWAGLLLALALSTAALALAPRSQPIAMASAVLFGGGYIALTGVLILWASRVVPGRAATAVAGVFLLLSLGQVVGAGLVGRLIGSAGWIPAFLTAAGFALASMPLAVGADRGDQRAHGLT